MNFVRRLKRAIKVFLDEEEPHLENSVTSKPNDIKHIDIVESVGSIEPPKKSSNPLDIQSVFLNWKDEDGYEWDITVETSHWIDGNNQELFESLLSKFGLSFEIFEATDSYLAGGRKELYFALINMECTYKTIDFPTIGGISLYISIMDKNNHRISGYRTLRGRVDMDTDYSSGRYRCDGSSCFIVYFDKGIVPNNPAGKYLDRLNDTRFVIENLNSNFKIINYTGEIEKEENENINGNLTLKELSFNLERF